jgi:flagellar motility protein MotE (MotC chaperone)
VIVTRRRRKPFPWKRLLLPLVAIALVIFAFAWGPSRNVITNGPVGPLWQNIGQRFATIAAPFNFAKQLQVETDQKGQIAQLQGQISDLKTQGAAKDKQISSLNGQVNQLQTQAANAASAVSAPSIAPVSGAANGGNAASAGVSGAQTAGGDQTSAQMRRAAQVWANMQPENAAKVIQKLPIPYVAQVLALMSPDDAGAILDAVPATFAAEVTQENPGLKR